MGALVFLHTHIYIYIYIFSQLNNRCRHLVPHYIFILQ
jgi:hypothetical protein